MVSLVCIIISHGYAATKKTSIHWLFTYCQELEFYFELNDDETYYDFYKTWMNLGQGCDQIGWAWDSKCIQIIFFDVVHDYEICQ